MLTVIRKTKIFGIIFENVKTLRLLSTLKEKSIEEIQIPVPWGYIAGKWWGNKNIPPVLALHGWQDNANSFDKLLPLINLQSVLAIDLPGHGISSHLPIGKFYDMREFLIWIHFIKNYLKLSSMSILGHSFGSCLGLAYCALYPQHVKWLISLECARTLLTLYRVNLSTAFNRVIDQFLRFENRVLYKQRPCYPLQKLVAMIIEGSLGSIQTPEAAVTLLRRGLVSSDKPCKSETVVKEAKGGSDLNDFLVYNVLNTKKLAKSYQEETATHNTILMNSLKKAKLAAQNYKVSEEEKNKFYSLQRDPMTRVLFFHCENEDLVIESSKLIKCPCLNIRAKHGFVYGSVKKTYMASVNIIKENSKYSEYHECNGTHHCHLNTPEEMSGIINNFIKKFVADTAKPSSNLTTKECSEETVSVFTGKRWGVKNLRPVLCVHGRLDNANSFDTLIPLLPAEFCYVAIDLPGHGLSSHIPPGVFYTPIEYISIIRRIQFHFNWSSFGFLGHSFGCGCGLVFSSSYPKDINFFVAIENIKPLTVIPSEFLKSTPKTVEKMLELSLKPADSAPLYEEEELMKILITSSGDSLTEKSCKILMQRGVEKVKGKFRVRRDERVEYQNPSTLVQRDILDMVRKVECRVMFIKSKSGAYKEKKEYVEQTVTAFKNSDIRFEYLEFPGTTHLHLNNPEVIAPDISRFMLLKN